MCSGRVWEKTAYNRARQPGEVGWRAHAAWLETTREGVTR